MVAMLAGGFVAMLAATLTLRRAEGALQHPLVAASLVTASVPSQLPVPVKGVRPSDLRDTWGAARSEGRRHRGIDIFAPRGRAVVSATRGIVVTVGTNRLGGRIVRVLGPGGQWHYYAHLDRFAAIHPGQVIAAGTVLGYVGDSGNARGTPPHLHYGVYRFRGGAINPYPLIAARGPSKEEGALRYDDES
jgi:murein DD-endopeptidase MepM/ murein hydrolase activator NlpD